MRKKQILWTEREKKEKWANTYHLKFPTIVISTQLMNVVPNYILSSAKLHSKLNEIDDGKTVRLCKSTPSK